MVSSLIEAEEDGERLNENELLAMIFLLLVAGYETTVYLIGNGMLALLERPQQMDHLRQNPVLIKPAVEELLRYGSPLDWVRHWPGWKRRLRPVRCWIERPN